MGLEKIEEVCLSFLRRTTSPLVPLDTLRAACEKENLGITMDELTGFLRHHSEVIVVDGADETAPVSHDDFSEAGINMGPRAILKARVPSRSEMTEMMQQQLDHMRFHLQDALKKAREHQDDEAVEEIEAALEKNRQLEAKMMRYLDNGNKT